MAHSVNGSVIACSILLMAALSVSAFRLSPVYSADGTSFFMSEHSNTPLFMSLWRLEGVIGVGQMWSEFILPTYASEDET